MLAVFLLAGRTQAADFTAVSAFLDDAVAIPLASRTMSARSAADLCDLDVQLPEVTARGTASLLVCLERLRRRHGRFVVVSGQDIGTFQRLALSWAQRRGCPTALLPDGIAFHVGYERSEPSSARGRLRAGVDRSGLLAGDPMGLGRSNPDLILSWGKGWNDLWRAHAPSADIVVTGSPRSDALLSSEPPATGTRILLCSQPLWQAGFRAAPEELDAWYRWLGTSAEALRERVEVRIRLHPAEMGVISEFTARHDLGRFVVDEPIRASLTWSSHVVAPASTIVLEGAALGRRAGLVAAVGAVRTKWKASPLFGAADWSRLDIAEPLRPDALDFRHVDTESYLANTGCAAQAAATALLGRFS